MSDEPCPKCEEFRRQGLRQPLFAFALFLRSKVDPNDQEVALMRHFDEESARLRGKTVKR